MNNLLYRSRISVFLSLLMVAVVLPIMLPVFKAETSIVAIAIMATIPIFILCCFVTTRYIVKDRTLVIKSLGVKIADIDIAYIRSIKRSYNPISSPAISLKRLRVTFYSTGGIQTVLISPVREQEFIALLKTINPTITTQINDKTGVLRFWDWDI